MSSSILRNNPLACLVSASLHQQETIRSSLSTQQPRPSISILPQKKWLCVSGSESEATFPRPLLMFQLGGLTHPSTHPLYPHPPHTNTLYTRLWNTTLVSPSPSPSPSPHAPFVMSHAKHKRKNTRARYCPNGKVVMACKFYELRPIAR